MAEEIIKNDPQTPLPGGKPVVVGVNVGENTQTLLYVIFLLYKAHLIARNNLKEMIEIVNLPLPKEGVAKFLVNEAAKA